MSAALLWPPAYIPVVYELAFAAEELFVNPAPPTYPVASKLPDPMRIKRLEAVVVKLTPASITVMRLTHDGMPVKSADVPDVVVTAVPDTIGASVPVAATNVCVLVPATAGAATVTVPEVEPSSTKGDGDVIPVVPLMTTDIISPRKVC